MYSSFGPHKMTSPSQVGITHFYSLCTCVSMVTTGSVWKLKGHAYFTVIQNKSCMGLHPPSLDMCTVASPPNVSISL